MLRKKQELISPAFPHFICEIKEKKEQIIMKRLLVCNLPNIPNRRYRKENILPIINCQIDSLLTLGWDKKNILLLTNFEHNFMDVRAIKINFNKQCLTGSKLWAAQYIFKNGLCEEMLWAGDLDLWMSVYFDEPEILDVGLSTYSNAKKLNGGNIFWNPKSIDIIDNIIKTIEQRNNQKEEPAINEILKSDEYKKRVTILNTTWNCGCSGFYPRFLRANKPIKCVHLNINNRLAWETHTLSRDGMGVRSVSKQLEHILRKYFPNLATKLSPEGEKRSVELRTKHLNKIYIN